MRHRVLLFGVILTFIGFVGFEAVHMFVLDPNFITMEAPPLPFYAFPLSVITFGLLFSLPAAIIVQAVISVSRRWVRSRITR